MSITRKVAEQLGDAEGYEEGHVESYIAMPTMKCRNSQQNETDKRYGKCYELQ